LKTFLFHSLICRLTKLPRITLLILFAGLMTSNVQAQTGSKEDSLYIRAHYTKIERQVPVRDGVKLFTSIYLPKDISKTKTYPILLNRTPYSVAPYGEDLYKTPRAEYALCARRLYCGLSGCSWQIHVGRGF
jgi:predicted acyl esterase